MALRKYREKLGFVRFYSGILVIVAAAFYAGIEFAKVSQTNQRAQISLLTKSIGNLRLENETLQSQYNVLKVELDIAQLTNEHSKKGIQDAIQREQTLQEQVLFYQRVMAPEMTQDGFIVQRMEITPTASERNFRLSMILLQYENIKAVIKGDLVIYVHGSAQGKPAQLNLVTLLDDPATELAFAFRYFQVIEAGITLPIDFIPERVDINTDVYKFRTKRGSYATSIKWQDALSEMQ